MCPISPNNSFCKKNPSHLYRTLHFMTSMSLPRNSQNSVSMRLRVISQTSEQTPGRPQGSAFEHHLLKLLATAAWPTMPLSARSLHRGRAHVPRVEDNTRNPGRKKNENAGAREQRKNAGSCPAPGARGPLGKAGPRFSACGTEQVMSTVRAGRAPAAGPAEGRPSRDAPGPSSPFSSRKTAYPDGRKAEGRASGTPVSAGVWGTPGSRAIRFRPFCSSCSVFLCLLRWLIVPTRYLTVGKHRSPFSWNYEQTSNNVYKIRCELLRKHFYSIL